jgi:hypothetical protein
VIQTFVLTRIQAMKRLILLSLRSFVDNLMSNKESARRGTWTMILDFRNTKSHRFIMFLSLIISLLQYITVSLTFFLIRAWLSSKMTKPRFTSLSENQRSMLKISKRRLLPSDIMTPLRLSGAASASTALQGVKNSGPLSCLSFQRVWRLLFRSRQPRPQVQQSPP